MKIEIDFADKQQLQECIQALTNVVYWREQQQMLFGDHDTCGFIEVLLTSLKKKMVV